MLSDHLSLKFSDDFVNPSNMLKGYEKIEINTVIKLLIRCRMLYQALHEIKLILQLVIKQEEIFKDLIPSCEKVVNDNAILSGLLVL